MAQVGLFVLAVVLLSCVSRSTVASMCEPGEAWERCLCQPGEDLDHCAERARAVQIILPVVRGVCEPDEPWERCFKRARVVRGGGAR